MNIYLDIDGVLLANTSAAANFADDFLQIVLDRFPDSTYWLTTHCWRGQNRAAEVLKPVLRPETYRRLKIIKPTDWYELKTDAIDFRSTFLWFDDDLFPDEREVLEAYGATDSWVGIDLAADPNQLLDEIARIKSLA